ELSARAGRASAARATAIVRMDRPRRPAATAAGFSVLTVAVILIGSALVLRPGVAPMASRAPNGNAPAVGTPSVIHVTTADGTFRLDLDVPTSHYITTDAIAPVATLTYVGPAESATVFHAASPIGFRINEVGGNRVMGGGMDQPCLSTPLTKGTGKGYPFEKAGSPTDDPSAGFDGSWYQDPVLRLPAGQWRIMVELDAYLGGCGGAAERHQLTLSAEVTVIPFGPSNEAVRTSKADGTLRLTLTTPHGIYGPNDAIEPVATVAYLGPNAETTIYTGDPTVLFTIEELGGGRRMDPFQNLPCKHTLVDQAAPLTFSFMKSGPFGTSFDRAWYQDPVLRLPVGTWRIQARLDADTTDGTDTCGGIPHDLVVDNVIEVVAGDAPTPAPTPSPTTSAEPSAPDSTAASNPADAAVARAFVVKFEDGLATGHADQAWLWLSPWSQRAVGSLAEFGQRFARSAGAAPVEISEASQNPELLAPEFLGERAADIAASADPARTYLVSVLDPSVDGAAAGTTNLVVAPTADGTWQIWLDIAGG
ncbi:MAG TPA: hypothetical protein VGJ71_00540, partial [Candidatus Limnocylindrales bacterium]